MGYTAAYHRLYSNRGMVQASWRRKSASLSTPFSHSSSPARSGGVRSFGACEISHDKPGREYSREISHTSNRGLLRTLAHSIGALTANGQRRATAGTRKPNRTRMGRIHTLGPSTRWGAREIGNMSQWTERWRRKDGEEDASPSKSGISLLHVQPLRHRGMTRGVGRST